MKLITYANTQSRFIRIIAEIQLSINRARTKTEGHKGGHDQKLPFQVIWYIALHGFVACQTTPYCVEIHVHSSPSHCLFSKCGSLRAAWFFALLSTFCFCRLFISLDRYIKAILIIFQGQAGPRQVDVSRLDAKLNCHSSLRFPGASFGNCWLWLRHRFGCQ